MYFNKYPHAANFTFADSFDEATRSLRAGNRVLNLLAEGYADDVLHLGVKESGGWGPNRCLVDLNPPVGDCHAYWHFAKDGQVIACTHDGDAFWRATLGVCGEQWMLRIPVGEGARFYGLGEKNLDRFELSLTCTKFYNTDVWADFHPGQWRDQPLDPPYLSIPYLVIKQAERFIGVLIHTPHPSFMNLSPVDGCIHIGAEGGRPNVWVLDGPSLKTLTRKLQMLTGPAPTPPLWALGYHQCRWGYGGDADLTYLDENFAKHEIPCDGLWLDIDYMDGYRVFTTSRRQFPKSVARTLKHMARRGRRVVPILDPGVKAEPGNPVYDDGHAKDVFCHNAEGKEFIGIVWPGQTVFPDFTLKESRTWWAGYCTQFLRLGFGGAWVDMNDPSTGSVDPFGMLFNRGKEEHAHHHNEFALGMQMATRDGFLKARPNERPFILTRSGFVGTSRFAAAWTGDNVSNYFYLRGAIPTSLNLSLSGLGFNGPDVGGFGGDTNDGLICDWTKACFLFPFMRNHTGRGTRRQEPWALSEETLNVMRRYIRLRYKLLPYLYNLFVDQEELGDPPLRPLLYEFSALAKDGLEEITHEFLVGPAILQAPVLDARRRMVSVLLPGDAPWLDARTGEWVMGQARVRPSGEETPLYLREGAVVPMQRGVAKTNAKDLARVDILIAARPGASGNAVYRYRIDDGLSFDYRKGRRSCLEIRVSWSGDTVMIESGHIENGFGAIQAKYLLLPGFKQVSIDGAEFKGKPDSLELTGAPIDVRRYG
jgi:alpha-glucosidase